MTGPAPAAPAIPPAPAVDDDALTRAEAARRDGNPLAVFDLAKAAIEAGRPEPRFRYLQVHASAQMGDTRRAERLYETHRLGERVDDEDSLALRGRLHKDLALASRGPERRARFAAASAAYLRAFALRSGYFPGINAATTAWGAGDLEAARRMARAVLDHPDLNPARDFFAAASRAEALILLGEGGKALAAVRAALTSGVVGYGERGSACRQLEWLCAESTLALDEQAALLAALRPPPILAFTGHRFRAGPGEAELAARIDAAIDALGATIAYGALACGADILIAEAILRRGGELQVVLPCAVDAFVRAAVAPGGDAWIPRFHACLERAAAVTFATRADDAADSALYAYAERLAGGLALLRAGQIAATAVQLAVWDDASGQASQGAAANVAAWRDLGLETRVVAPGAVDRHVDRGSSAGAGVDPTRVTRAIIFTDYKNYSKLPESAIPAFQREIMGRIGRVLDGHDGAVCSRNTWGDAFHGVIADAPSAADITLEIVESLHAARIPGLPEEAQGGTRVGLHFGPVYQDIDPVTGRDTFYGTEVTLTARIEPAAIPGEIYATQAFAAILAMTAPGRFGARYLGRLELAKGYGTLPIYQLERA